MHLQPFLLPLLLLLLLPPTTSTLHPLSTWDLTLPPSPTIYPTQIPSTLFQTLIDNGLIQKDPYFEDNFLQFYQYQNQTMVYKTNFTLPEQCKMPISLVFQGTDTHADIYLNDEKILQTHNFFRKYQVTVENILQQNTLQVRIAPSPSWDISHSQTFHHLFNFALPQNFSYSRKPAYHYGWDWGPRIVNGGLWKPVYFLCQEKQGNLEQVEKFKVTLSSPVNKSSEQISLSVAVQINNFDEQKSHRCWVKIFKQQEIVFQMKEPFECQSASFSTKIIVSQKQCKLPFKNILWNTWDIGEPNLLDFVLRVETTSKQNKSQSQFLQKKIKTGLRSIQLIQIPDKLGSSFYFRLNGQDIFMRGGNYIPPQMSMAKVSSDVYEKIGQNALFAKYNMIRVWGGGQYQHDIFYETMDKLGILIWHDLMFACAMYPIFPNSSDYENIKQEIYQNIERIGFHPSIALWNGNNQVMIGWKQWGWQNGLNDVQKLQAQIMYKQIFQQIIPEVITKLTPQIPYWETSPSVSSSSTPDTIFSGDIHFWQVWASGVPIELYKQFTGRFNSEYGMQSIPLTKSLQKFIKRRNMFYDSQIMKLHQRHPQGHKLLKKYTQDYVGESQSLDRFSYYSQIMQAYAFQMAIAYLRANKPITMGSLYWQLNDVWPVTSWSSVDYYNVYKVAHYRIKQMHSVLLIYCVQNKENKSMESMKTYNQSNVQKNSTFLENDSNISQIHTLFAVNDHVYDVDILCKVQVIDIWGKISQLWTIRKTIKSMQNTKIQKIDLSSNKLSQIFINIDCYDSVKGQRYNHLYFPSKPIQRTIIDPQLKIIVEQNKLTIKTRYLANYVWIYLPQMKERDNLQENYFDLSPQEYKSISIDEVQSREIWVTCYQMQKLELEPIKVKIPSQTKTMQKNKMFLQKQNGKVQIVQQ